MHNVQTIIRNYLISNLYSKSKYASPRNLMFLFDEKSFGKYWAGQHVLPKIPIARYAAAINSEQKKVLLLHASTPFLPVKYLSKLKLYFFPEFAYP